MKRCGLVMLALVLASSCIGTVMFVTNQTVQRRNWVSRQMAHAITIGGAIRAYRDAHGSYPEALGDLVCDGLMTDKRFRELLFQQTPQSERQEWSYHSRADGGGMLIVSPVAIPPWGGSRGVFVTAGDDGRGELIPADKKPEWDNLHKP